MNPNSPTWPRARPERRPRPGGRPARVAPRVTVRALSAITRPVKSSTSGQSRRRTAGSMSIPTATKNMAAKRSRRGWIRCSTLRPRPDSHTSIPATKAPMATEKPAQAASWARPKQRPAATTSRTSPRAWSATQRTAGGTSQRPAASRRARKAARRRRVAAMAPRLGPPREAAAVSPASSSTAWRSSTRSTPRTVSFSGPRMPRSSKSLARIMVEAMERLAPKKALSRGGQPSSRATRKPATSSVPTCRVPTRRAVGPARNRRCRLNSRPMENMRRMTPSSPMIRTLPRSATRGTGTCGPTIMPARR